MAQLLQKTAQRFLETFKVGLPSDPETPLLETEIRILRRHLYTMVSEALLTVTERWEQHKQLRTMYRKRRGSEQRNAARRKKEENPVTCRLDIKDVVLGEISQSWMNTAWCYLRKASEGVKLTEWRVEQWLPGAIHWWCLSGKTENA